MHDMSLEAVRVKRGAKPEDLRLLYRQAIFVEVRRGAFPTRINPGAPLRLSSVVEGTLTAPRLIVEEGARLNGRVQAGPRTHPQEEEH